MLRRDATTVDGVGPGPFSTAAITDYYTADDAPGGLGGLIIESQPEEALRLRPDEQIIRLEPGRKPRRSSSASGRTDRRPRRGPARPSAGVSPCRSPPGPRCRA
ncbi:hypothetical protein GCM10010429_19580 [Micromonospora olivasterospora]